MTDSNFKPRNILLIGATGTIGRFITSSIVAARSEFDRIAILTNTPTAVSEKEKFVEELKAKNVEIIIGDITNEKDVVEAYKGIDTVVVALGRGAILPQILLIKLAAASSSVKWYFPSEYGTDIKYSPASATEKPHQGKLKVRDYLENDKEIQKSGLKYTYVVTGPYADGYLQAIPNSIEAGGWDVKSKTSWLVEKNNKVSLTTMKDTGDLVLAALRHPEASFNRALKVNSFTTTPAEVQREFEKQAGGSWTVHEISLDQIRKAEEAAWASRPDATGLTLRRIWAEGGTLYEKRDNGLIGEPQVQSLAEIVSENIKRSA
ncbi:isoflavone reductase family protein [Talaromyces proteolyticus]|uniref:Isoflavone reductase family protein n=1 Tax=Talaromyces proteolyticus TaxID=1131652 RepID=A0AAD4KVN9_9EURO|nr:isoflavone reductase family protein [Talaromyces proteolyticus]KAH8697149.1 isoflavone reductase family protein [Talaromyces proteolyticus]